MIDLFEIHTHRRFDLSQFYVNGPSLENGLPSGDIIVDSLANLYNLSPDYISSIDFSILNSPNNLDPFALSNASWDPIEDSLQESFQWGPKIYPSSYFFPTIIPVSDWDIQFKFNEEYTTLIYTYFWHFFHRNWEFKFIPIAR